MAPLPFLKPEKALGIDDHCPPLALGLGLLGDGPYFVRRLVDVLELEGHDLDAPRGLASQLLMRRDAYLAALAPRE